MNTQGILLDGKQVQHRLKYEPKFAEYIIRLRANWTNKTISFDVDYWRQRLGTSVIQINKLHGKFAVKVATVHPFYIPRFVAATGWLEFDLSQKTFPATVLPTKPSKLTVYDWPRPGDIGMNIDVDNARRVCNLLQIDPFHNVSGDPLQQRSDYILSQELAPYYYVDVPPFIAGGNYTTNLTTTKPSEFMDVKWLVAYRDNSDIINKYERIGNDKVQVNVFPYDAEGDVVTVNAAYFMALLECTALVVYYEDGKLTIARPRHYYLSKGVQVNSTGVYRLGDRPLVVLKWVPRDIGNLVGLYGYGIERYVTQKDVARFTSQTAIPWKYVFELGYRNCLSNVIPIDWAEIEFNIN